MLKHPAKGFPSQVFNQNETKILEKFDVFQFNNFLLTRLRDVSTVSAITEN